MKARTKHVFRFLSVCTLVGLLSSPSQANPPGGLLGGDAGKALREMMQKKGQSGNGAQPKSALDILNATKKSNEGGKKGGVSPLELMGNALEAKKNSTLGPMGRYFAGRAISAQLISTVRVLPIDDPLTQYVRAVALTVLGASNYAGNYREPLILVVDDKEIINACVAPGGFIFVWTGLLDFVKNEDELAFVLGHEVAHVELDHTLNDIKSRQAAGLFKDATGNALDGMGGLFRAMELGFSAELEGEADARGAELAVKAGYDPRAGVAVIERLEKLQGRKHGTGYPADRRSAIERVAMSSKPVSAAAVAKRTERFRARLARQ